MLDERRTHLEGGGEASGGGRQAVRRDLYLAAFMASRCDPELMACRVRLIEAGKPTKVALIAVARKLLIRINAMFCDGTEYRRPAQ